MEKNTVILDLKEYEDLKYDYKQKKKALSDVLHDTTTEIKELGFELNGMKVISLFLSKSETNDKIIEANILFKEKYDTAIKQLEHQIEVSTVQQENNIKLSDKIEELENLKWWQLIFK